MQQRFLAPLRKLGEFTDIQKYIFNRRGIVDLEGCLDVQKLHMIYGIPDGRIDESKLVRLIVTYDEIRANAMYEDFLLYDKRAAVYPARDLIFYQADIKGNLLTRRRMEALRAVCSGECVTVITTIEALMEHTAPPKAMTQSIITLKKGESISEEELAKRLVIMGYEKVGRVEDAGQFAIRGGIVDVYSMTAENPFRVELWGEDIDSIRSFDCESQRSIKEEEEVTIYPATELVVTQEEKLAALTLIEDEAKELEEKLRGEFKTQEAHRLSVAISELREQIVNGFDVPLDAYLPYFYKEDYSLLDLFDREKTVIFIDEPARVLEKGMAVEEEFKVSMESRAQSGMALGRQMDIIYPVGMVFGRLEGFYCAALSTLHQKQNVYKCAKSFGISAKSVNSYNNSFEALVTDLQRYQKKNYSVMLVCPSVSRAQRMVGELTDRGLKGVYFTQDDRVIGKSEIMLTYGSVSKGFEYPLSGFVLICESDIFGSSRKKRIRKKNFKGMGATGFSQLSVGDYVVHENHGLGIYQGIEHIESDGVSKDYMKISYRDGGNLYIPATGFDVIQKFASADAKKPKLNKLGGSEWTKTKSKVKTAVNEVARDLVQLYAKRLHETGYAYGEDTVWQKEFEELFPFEETDDQKQAIDETKSDMMSPKIMDRLICGDVGFGKTEVALRAAFKAVQEGKQVAFLVPTTILASQHYNNFVQRLKDFPVNVDMLCRFRSAAQQRETVRNLKKGLVDIVVGTHRLLSKDVEFKDLGLLVIDEEQRFGVSHKEKIKKMRENVDVLALSATPIPRTLHMSLSGIRDMSLLEEAPEERMPVQTFVMEYNEEMVREAISRELSRGGQVYYVYNRVNTIADVAAGLKKLVPDAQIDFAHGKMKESELEDKMIDFVNGDIDVLVSTTIIETGLDIPNVNTIIVHDSDRMGLSQLYQLRGRVGRSNRVAYAFLMYKRDKLLRSEAEKRLSAIREFTELGSGFRIAMKDLEIRGAGNILGKSQSGHIEAVGYELYCKLLNEAVRKEKGEVIRERDEFVTQVDIDIDAYIPSEYIGTESVKLDMYKRISCLESEGEAEDMVAEMTDRFGKVPRCVIDLIRVSLVRDKAHKVYIETVKNIGKNIELKFFQGAKLDPGAIPGFIASYGGLLRFKSAGVPVMIYEKRDEGDVLDMVNALLTDMIDKLL